MILQDILIVRVKRSQPSGLPLNKENIKVQRRRTVAACQLRQIDHGTCQDGARCHHLTPVPPVLPPYKYLLSTTTLLRLHFDWMLETF